VTGHVQLGISRSLRNRFRPVWVSGNALYQHCRQRGADLKTKNRHQGHEVRSLASRKAQPDHGQPARQRLATGVCGGHSHRLHRRLHGLADDRLQLLPAPVAGWLALKRGNLAAQRPVSVGSRTPAIAGRGRRGEKSGNVGAGLFHRAAWCQGRQLLAGRSDGSPTILVGFHYGGPVCGYIALAAGNKAQL
jgi:hypothetical protein